MNPDGKRILRRMVVASIASLAATGGAIVWLFFLGGLAWMAGLGLGEDGALIAGVVLILATMIAGHFYRKSIREEFDRTRGKRQ